MQCNEWFGQEEGLSQESDGQFLWLKAISSIVGGLGHGINWVVYQDLLSCFSYIEATIKENIW